MKDSAPFLAGWALWMTVLAAIAWIWIDDELPPTLLSLAALGTAAIAVAAWFSGRGQRRLVADSSLPAVVVAFGLAMTLNGLAFGLWLVLIGAEIVLLGLFGLGRELFAARRGRR